MITKPFISPMFFEGYTWRDLDYWRMIMDKEPVQSERYERAQKIFRHIIVKIRQNIELDKLNK